MSKLGEYFRIKKHKARKEKKVKIKTYEKENN